MSKTLLIVDDNRGNSDLYKMRFEFDKWDVQVAYSAEKALEMLQGGYHPDAILLDLMLPKMQGDELLHVIRKELKLKDIVIVILTALSLNLNDEERITGDADDYIMKISILPQQLVERVTELVQKKKATQVSEA